MPDFAVARRLARLDHPNIVHVHQVFEENNTAYMVMDFVDGLDLVTIREQEPSRLTRAVLERALRDTLGALAYVHDLDILHRDISLDNLLLDDHGRLTLIDFGAAREGQCRKTRPLSAVLSVKDGYSPHEFYLKDMPQMPASDLYSVAATFYHLITGSPPPDSQKRLAALDAVTLLLQLRREAEGATADDGGAQCLLGEHDAHDGAGGEQQGQECKQGRDRRIEAQTLHDEFSFSGGARRAGSGEQPPGA